MIVIRDVLASDKAAWHALWTGYLAFDGTTLDEAVTAYTWQRLLDPDSPVKARVALQDLQLAGFAVFVIHDGTWSLTPFCYLEDLFVDPQVRGCGIGKALIDDVIELARQRGWARVYWNTRESNAVARRLYDRFGAADGFVRYRLEI
jgi:ribosomal protein S18 acetylase RimI-like enzyme